MAKAPWHRLSRAQAEALDAVRSPSHASALAECHRGALEGLVELGLVAFYEDRYLSLVTEPEIGERLSAEREEILARTRRGGDAPDGGLEPAPWALLPVAGGDPRC